jgi:hypothetical protein
MQHSGDIGAPVAFASNPEQKACRSRAVVCVEALNQRIFDNHGLGIDS